MAGPVAQGGEEPARGLDDVRAIAPRGGWTGSTGVADVV